ncbi:MAG TPA: hypothetical protein VK633_04130, partial [Verrucomicrobiae bacterium]|nr:hypothetical protein [Verrucomicrobiae bacterium]
TQLPRAAETGAGALWNSFFFSVLAASGATLVALVVGRWWFCSLAWLPFLAPGILVGLIFIELFNRPGWQFFYQSSGMVVVALALRYLALPWVGIRQALAAADPNLEDAGRIETTSSWQLWRHVYWPQLASQAALIWYLTYLLCLWDVETLLLLIPPGGETVALRVFNLLHYGHTSDVNALCFLLLLVGLAPWLLWRGLHLLRTRLAVGLFLLALTSGCSPAPAPGNLLKSRFFARVEIIGTRGTGAGQFNKPRSVAVDTNDNLYVVDMTGRVQRFSPEGNFLNSWQMPQTDKGKPKGMTCDRDGNIVVLEPHYSRVNHYSPNGQLIAQWGEHGTNGGALAFPRSLAVSSRSDIYVSEYGLTERVQCFSPAGKTWRWQSGSPGSGPGEFNRPEGLGIDGQDQLYVADSCNHRIQILSSSGAPLAAFGKAGHGPGEFSYPYDVRIDRAGYQFVCEFGNNRLQVFAPDHRPLEIIGQPGTAPGCFNNPWSLALDSRGNLYVADANNHRVQKFIRRPESGGQRAADKRRMTEGDGGISALAVVRPELR